MNDMVGMNEVKEAYIKVKKIAQQMELTINQQKTKFMEVRNNKIKRTKRNAKSF
jgi:hypothetical protein